MTTLSVQQLEALWINAGGDKKLAPVMAAIALAESSGRPTATNPSGATGLWQIMWPLWRGVVPGATSQQGLEDPATNAKAAVAVYQKQGLHAWTTYTSGAYKAHLPKAKSALGQVEGDLSKWLKDLGGSASSAGSAASAVSSAFTLGLPPVVNDFFSSAEQLLKAGVWLVQPSSWARIIAAFGAFILLCAGLIALGKAA